ncbi:HlyD family efflux transporter periplasmic adaptor subunit [Cognatiyoonia sp. IB215182]|uniref:HlyD family efflux transporter periplasmic adaptor subunit n=1 Tax=Cognatiyoonia sp. IB215182 TaxID=3097353 RepID=UPI002A1506A9|nr:HlyD family efflux transporter periplasmic adaptor subunit [Cognatiyoonia sp. IB215182]MDX8354912.1 HlyD family efflux transporter periplasmic adaptor subunit [Cognatiyoonia sp. IB215182]
MPDKPSSSIELPLADTGIAESDRTAPMPTGRRRLIWVPLFFLILFLGGFMGLYFQPPGIQAIFRATGLEPGGGTDTPIAVAIAQVSTGDEIAVVSEGDVVALGRVTPKGDVVTVALPFGAGDARIRELRVETGDQVTSGEILAVLDSLPQYEGQLATARANLTVAEANLTQTQAATRAGRDEADAALERAIATETAAQEELTRTTALMERGVTTRAVLDNAIARATEAARDVEKARATLSRYNATDDTPQADIAVALANVEASRAQLSLAELDVEKAYVRAPQDGTVLDVHVSPGERPDSDGVLDLGNTTEMTVEAEVYQTLIGRVAVGDPATITADALNGSLNGTVNAIGLEIGRQSITSDDPAANTDARVVDVVITLDAASSAQAERLTNLQVVVRIDAGRTQP